MDEQQQKEALVEMEQMAIELEKWLKTPLGKYIIRSLDSNIDQLNTQVDASLPGEQLVRILSKVDGVKIAKEVFDFPIRMRKEGAIDEAIKNLSSATDSQETT